jgi:dUTP pyrophosphatase
MKVNFKKLHENAELPFYAKEGDAGMDMKCVDFDLGKDIITYKTGIAVEIPDGYVGLIFPRSSIRKTGLILTNSVGVIDSGYRGEIMASFKVLDNPTYNLGDKVCQLIILPYPKIKPEFVDKLSETDRGEGGFGSTGE